MRMAIRLSSSAQRRLHVRESYNRRKMRLKSRRNVRKRRRLYREHV